MVAPDARRSCRTAIALALALVLVSVAPAAFAQRGKHGARVVTAANTVVNESTPLTANAAAGQTVITVADGRLNANGRFADDLQPGDLLLVYQAQGATINGTLAGGIGVPDDATWGEVTSYGHVGRHEFVQVRGLSGATTIQLDAPLANAYQTGGTRRAVVVRVPRWTSLTVNAGAVLTVDDWSGAVGGVLAIEVLGTTTIAAGGAIDASGKGFRGGSLDGDNISAFGVGTHAAIDPAAGAAKGEGIAGYLADYDPYGGRYGRGAPANGGGGGNAHNAGGGGGANVAAGGAPWRGLGLPDLGVPAWSAAWNLDDPLIVTLTAATSAGGGRGGYSFSAQNLDALATPPGNAAWGGDARAPSAAGLGGRPLDPSGERIFLGGGGGAGDQNNSFGGVGGDGGGLVYLLSYGPLSGGGRILANGIRGADADGTPAVNGYSGSDGAGGGGGGGTIIMQSTGAIADTLELVADGGGGGNQVMVAGPFFFGAINEAQGPGGGGGGGYIARSNGNPVRSVAGGANGTTNSAALVEFIPNGAMRGAPGVDSGHIAAWTLSAPGVAIAAGTPATLVATLSPDAPAGLSICWYDALVAGNRLAVGDTFVTPPLFTAATYYVGTCPGSYRIPVQVATSFQADLSISIGNGSNPVVPGATTTYTIIAANAGPSPVTGATASTAFPGSLACTWACVATPGGTCTAAGSGSISDPVDLPSGGSATYTATCVIAGPLVGMLTSSAAISEPPSTTDPNPANNTASDVDEIAPDAMFQSSFE